jgi:CRISPR/Cas system-associated endonuclease Cas3-HD
LKTHFGSDERRIDHALKVLEAAEIIMNGEKVDAKVREVVTITALLHDVGIKAAEQKYNSSAGPYQEIEGPPVARKIMAQRGAPQEIMERVAYIVGSHHTASKNDGLDFQIIWEADLMVNIEEDGLYKSPEKLPAIISKNFKTLTGQRLAEERYLKPKL